MLMRMDPSSSTADQVTSRSSNSSASSTASSAGARASPDPARRKIDTRNLDQVSTEKVHVKWGPFSWAYFSQRYSWPNSPLAAHCATKSSPEFFCARIFGKGIFCVWWCFKQNSSMQVRSSLPTTIHRKIFHGVGDHRRLQLKSQHLHLHPLSWNTLRQYYQSSCWVITFFEERKKLGAYQNDLANWD